MSSTRSRKRKTLSTSSVTTSKSPSEGHSLDSFLSHYTSEDNNSFQELIETADKKLRQRFAVLYEAETSTAAAIANSLELPSIENQFRAIEGHKQVCIILLMLISIVCVIFVSFLCSNLTRALCSWTCGNTPIKITSCTCRMQWN